MFDTLTRLGSSAASDYEIERSLRFNDDDSAYLNRTPSSNGNKQIWTFSVWIKHTHISAGTAKTFFSAGSNNPDTIIKFDSDRFEISRYYNVEGGYTSRVTSTRVLRDPSAWYHLVGAVDTTQSTASNRVKLYVNGTQVTDFDNSNYPAQNFNYELNSTSYPTYIGRHPGGQYFDGYITEFNFVDGQQLTPASFAETNADTGQWVPKKYSGSYGTNGFFLNFSDNSGTSATTLGKDSSGNSNNFTPSNFSVTAGKDDDSMLDTPTNNFPTLSPVDRSLVGTISNGALRVSYNYKPASKTWRATMALPATGKFYWEWENEEASSHPGRWNTGLVRYTNETGVLDHQGYNDADYFSVSYGGSMWNGTTHINPSWGSYPTFYSGERVAIAIDCSNGKTWVGKVASGGGTTWYDDDGTTDGDPAGGTNETCTITGFTTGRWIPYIGWHDGGGAVTDAFTSNINFGNHSFLGTPPTGFDKLCTANLPDPTIKLPTDYFNTALYAGNGSTNSVTGLAFQPALTWVKDRNDSSPDHWICVDAVRTIQKMIKINEAETEYEDTGDFTSFNADGFSFGSYSNINQSGVNYASWNWKGGGAASSNSDGSITSSVSANTSAGFSIVSYTGSGSDATVGHGLGVKPDVIIVKSRTQGTTGYTGNWDVYNSISGATKYLYLNTTAALGDQANIWQDTEPTSSVFSIGTAAAVNTSSDSFIAYCFSGVAGYSKFGSFEGNGSTDGTFVFTGFKPAFFMVKNIDEANSWRMWDNKRPGYNTNKNYLSPDSSGGEGSVNLDVDILSNGIKLRNTNDSANKSGNTYIYLAFAETPFKYANAR